MKLNKILEAFQGKKEFIDKQEKRKSECKITGNNKGIQPDLKTCFREVSIK